MLYYFFQKELAFFKAVQYNLSNMLLSMWTDNVLMVSNMLL